jgi:hypothetical protein
MSSMFSEIYNDTASFGKFMAIISAILATVIGIVLIVAGVAEIRHVPIYTQVVNATIVNSPSCTSQVNGNLYSCMLTLKYTVNNVVYTSNLTTESSQPYMQNGSIQIYYNPKNPHQISQGSDNPKFGWWIIGLAVIIISVAWLMVWMVYKYKFAAAGSAVYAIFG